MTCRLHPVRQSKSGPGSVIRSKRGQAPYVLLVIVVGLVSATSSFASPSPSVSEKQAEARQVLDQVNALNTSLDRSDELVNFANYKLQQVKQDIAVNRHELATARHNLRESQREIARRLVNLYATGSTSTLEVILGAKSLSDVLNRIDAQNRVSALDAEVATQVALFRSSVRRHSVELAVEKAQVRQLVAERIQQRQAIETRLGERQRLLSSLNGEVQRLIAAQQARQLAAAQAAQAQAADAQASVAQSYADAAVGATAQTPEGATIVPPSSHEGVVGVAMQYLGVPYVWAGSSPSGFDCSGLVMYAYSQVGVSLPHSSYAMWNDGVPVSRDQLQPGDIVFFDGLGHVGLYIGGGEFVHAPHTGTVVQVSSLDEGSYASSFVGARRVL